jgi:hypothetical protein
MLQRDRDWWIQYLSRTAGDALHAAPAPGDVGDELGHRRDLQPVFFAWRRARLSGDPTAAIARDPGPTAGLDVRLWAALTDSAIDVDALLSDAASTPRGAADRGALLPQGLYRTIEVWTETELASLHALSRLGRVRSRADWTALALATAHWHVEHLQPDNATNRPWAVHLFATLAVQGDADAEAYAQTLVHNCHIARGKPDALSAHIIADAADALIL